MGSPFAYLYLVQMFVIGYPFTPALPCCLPQHAISRGQSVTAGYQRDMVSLGAA